MSNPALLLLSRPERRLALKEAARRRASGDWGPWETLPIPPGSIGDTWAREFTKLHRNQVFAALERTLGNGVTHLAVSSLSGVRPSWWEMQRIKNEIAGEHATGVEVYPPQGEVIDGADMYHLWIMPQPLDFSLYHEERGHPVARTAATLQ